LPLFVPTGDFDFKIDKNKDICAILLNSNLFSLKIKNFTKKSLDIAGVFVI